MATPIFPNGLNGLSDSKWSGIEGSADKIVGIDFRTTPGVIQAHQAMAKASSTTITELCKVSLAVSDGSVLWFSSESGKIWRESAGTYTLVHTTVPTSGSATCSGAEEHDGDVYWATEKYLHKIRTASVAETWSSNTVAQNIGEFKNGNAVFHPMRTQNSKLFIGDGQDIAIVENLYYGDGSTETVSVSFELEPDRTLASWWGINPSSKTPPEYLAGSSVATNSNSTTISGSFTVPEGGLDRTLFVLISNIRTDSSSGTATVTSVSFNGTPMSLLDSNVTGAGTETSRATVYVLNNPASITGNISVVVSSSSATRANTIHAFVLSGVNQTTQGVYIDEESSYDGSTVTQEITRTTENQVLLYTMTTIDDHVLTHTIPDSQTEIGNTTTPLTGELGVFSSSLIGAQSLGSSFSDRTLLRLKSPEYITTLHPFDIDLLIGTKTDNVNKARVLRWDTANANYSADDDVDESGINAFIKDDNFVYVQAGDYGRLYYYNGEKLEPYKRIPGAWSPSASARVYPNAVAFHMGLPVFGISNVTGNPLLQGIYGLGSYSSQYPKVLSLDFPLLETSGLTIGAIVAKGADLYASYKTATDVGVCKLNWSAKYASAYIESRMLTPSNVRSDLTTASRIFADYTSLPTSTGITIGIKKKYDTNYTSLTVKNDTKRMQVRTDTSIPEIANLQIRIGFTTSSNTSPVIENIAYE